MSLSIELLATSLEQIRINQDEFATRFYENLFAANPQLKPYFARTDMVKQRQMLMSALILIVKNLHKPQLLASTVKGLGSRHIGYGATEAFYPLVCSALLITFQEYLGAAWTLELEQSWVEAFDAVTKLMLEGAKSY
ncbi:MAG: globin domain-containing protein [Hydrococcus sp. Prado102]|jgi:hemoglobin-like flavoprotein|nr:globin domain-containing protein [Hydrococcus sp. Prado102]